LDRASDFGQQAKNKCFPASPKFGALFVPRTFPKKKGSNRDFVLRPMSKIATLFCWKMLSHLHSKSFLAMTGLAFSMRIEGRNLRFASATVHCQLSTVNCTSDFGQKNKTA